MLSSQKKELLKDLKAVQQKCAQFPHLNAAVSADFFEKARNRIETEAGRSHPLKLPVLFFFLKRNDLPELRSFEDFLARLKQGHRMSDLRHLLQRLLEESDYRQATGAIFEVEVLAKLLCAQGQVSVNLYPRSPTTQSKPDACISLAQKVVYIEITILSQTEDQEKIQDIGTKSLYEQVLLDNSEMEALGIRSVSDGVVVGVGDPYRDALRVIGKLNAKRKQLVPNAPNIICLGLPHPDPDTHCVEWGTQDFFSGSTNMAQAVQDRYSRLLINKWPKMPAEKVRNIQKKIQAFKGLMNGFKAEPQLTGVIAFRWKGNGFSPKEVFPNPFPGSLNRLTESEWKDIFEAFGLPLAGKRT
jgi:ribosomal 50S subunit-recycling heat shock protein